MNKNTLIINPDKYVKFCVAGALQPASFDEAVILKKKRKIGLFPVPFTIEDKGCGE